MAHPPFLVPAVTALALAASAVTVQTAVTVAPAQAADHHRSGPPTGSMYHAPDGSPYHTENSPSGIVRADRLGYDQIDLDLRMTRDGVIVATHWAAPMVRDGFHDTRGRLRRDRVVASMTWTEVSRLRTSDGYRIFTLRKLIPMLGKRHLVGSLEVKGDRRFAHRGVMTELAAWCREHRVRAYVKAIPKLGRRGRILAAARAAGFWTRNAGVAHQDWRPPKRRSR